MSTVLRRPKYFSEASKQPKAVRVRQGIAIEVPIEEQEVEEALVKLGKNSPTAAFVIKKQAQQSGNKVPTPKASSRGRQAQSSNSTPKSSTGQVFKFPQQSRRFTPSSKDSHKSPADYVFNVNPPNFSKSKTPGRKPTQKQPKDLESRPSTGTARKTAMLKTDLQQLVTRVSSNIKTIKSPDLTPEQAKQRSEQAYREHLFQTFQALKFVKTMQQVEPSQLIAKTVSLPKRRGYENKKTAIFDLDETLVHCVDDIELNTPDVVLPVTFPTGEIISAGINIRPYVLEVLQEANKNFEVIVFTASHKCYADVVLDYLDPTRELIHHRLYRDNCVSVQGVFIKDLRIFSNRRLQDIVIVDNAAYSFGNQLDNGIPIISWHDDRNDRELFNLQDYLKLLAQSPDVREVNNRTFHLQTFYEDYIEEFLTYKKLSSPKRSKRPVS
mmetsp:Transcript_33874/g.59029  ORF Transcript_33874/g.59029 Transcript_33874/m.59029 type:complete len:439 (-) Transcript_33874:1432-2748(-)